MVVFNLLENKPMYTVLFFDEMKPFKLQHAIVIVIGIKNKWEAKSNDSKLFREKHAFLPVANPSGPRTVRVVVVLVVVRGSSFIVVYLLYSFLISLWGGILDPQRNSTNFLVLEQSLFLFSS